MLPFKNFVFSNCLSHRLPTRDNLKLLQITSQTLENHGKSVISCARHTVPSSWGPTI